MKKIYTAKSNTPLVPQPRSFRRLINQMIDSILKRQPQKDRGDSRRKLIRQLKKLELKIEAVEQAMSQQIKRSKK